MTASAADTGLGDYRRWLQQPLPVPSAATASSGSWPKITLVTPSLNQGEYLETCLKSVVLQNYPNLELIVVDGGSSDNSVEVIRSFEPWISWWVSEKDRGQSHAINKGLSRGTGEWVGWLNADDFLLPGALFHLAETASANPGREWIIGSTAIVDREGARSGKAQPRCGTGPWYDYLAVRESRTEIPQPSTFWSRSALAAAGLLDESLCYAMDLEYWARLARKGFRPICLERELAAFRLHDQSKTGQGRLPFWREELRIVTSSLEGCSSEERKPLLRCRRFLARGILSMRMRLFADKLLHRLRPAPAAAPQSTGGAVDE